MSELNDKIAIADTFNGRDPHAAPIVDQSANASFGMDWASRQQPAQPETCPKMPPIIPVAN